MEKEKTTPSLSREGRGGSPVGGSALVSIIMGSTSDLPVMEKAMKFLDEMEVPFEVNALSAHRTPEAVEQFAKGAAARLCQVLLLPPPHFLLSVFLSKVVFWMVLMPFTVFCRCLPAFP